VNECAAISKNLHPRLELIEGLENLRFQVSSPGLDRVLKSEREYTIFAGRGVRVMLHGQKEWIRGKIEGVQEGVLSLDEDGKMKKIKIADIRKAKLDS